jgi:hypothetical protein
MKRETDCTTTLCVCEHAMSSADACVCFPIVPALSMGLWDRSWESFYESHAERCLGVCLVRITQSEGVG